MKRLKYFMILSLFLGFGCNKMVDVNTPPSVLYASAVFSDSANVKSAVLGLYGGIEKTNTYNEWLTLLNSLYADETTSISYPTFLANTLSPSGMEVDDIWVENYTNIYNANAIIEGVSSSTALLSGTKQQAMGEALFMRAYFHFNLVNTFGNIPLITSTNITANSTAPQVSAAMVYQQIITDLKEAIADLPANYSVSGNERTRVNKLAAIAMLAKVYLYNQDWVNAEIQAGLIIGNTLFNLPKDLNTTFLNSSTEAIFQLNNQTAGSAPDASIFVPKTGIVPSYPLRTELLNSFESGDLRKINWTGTSAGYYYPAKYKVAASGGNEYATVLRLADIYLIRAEARAHQNEISGAQSDLNAVRTRAGLTNTLASDQTSLLLAVEQERRVELFCEWGNRFFDLKRTSRADAVLGAEKPGWKSTDVNYPIPLQEINTNHNLKQNPGY